MKTLKLIEYFVCLSALLIGLAISAVAQENSRLQGRVFDENGAVVVGAAIILENNQNQKLTATTGAQGQYLFPDLSNGKYTLNVNAQGFAESSQTVEIKNSTTLDVTLKITVNERIDVQIKSDNLTAVTLTGAKIDALPSDPRQLRLRLQRLANASGAANNLVVYVDGFREEGALPPKEAIAAILINAEPFAAQFPEPGKARVEIITKPATERLHGELNFNFSDESLNARNPFAPNRAAFQTRNFSGVLSAPIKRERWGFFAEFSRSETDENAVVNALVLNPALQPANFNTTVLTPAKATNFSIRMSRLFGAKHTFDARYLFADETASNQGLESGFDLPERGANRSSRDNTLRFSLVSTLTEKSLNEARLSLSRRHSNANALNQNPAIFVLDNFTSGGNQESLFLDDHAQSFRAEDNFTLIAKNHSLKFGVLAEAVKLENTDRSNFGGTFIFGTDFDRNATGFPLPGTPIITPLESYRRTLQRRAGYRPLQFIINQGDPFVNLTQWQTGVFAQDDWQISKRLTVSYGLRAEFQTNLDGKINLAPRAAVALRPFKNIESSLRVGAGLFYSRVDTVLTVDALRFDGTRQEELVIARPPFFPTIPAALNRATAQTTLRTKSPDLRAPAVFISTVSYQQQLPKNLTATVSYNFERGNYLLRTRNVNAPLAALNNQRPNSDVGAILQYESSGILKRHEFIAGLQGEINSKFNFYGSYRLAFAKSDTNGANNAPANSYDLTGEFGRSDNDQRHQFYFESYIQLPLGIAVSPNLFIASAVPFNITTGGDDNGDTLFTDRPAFASAGDTNAITTPFGIFNPRPQAGDKIIPRNFGRGAGEVSLNLNISRTFAFGAENASRDNCKSGKLRCGFVNRRYGLTFSADVFNLLNRTNFGEFNGVLSSPFFGRPNRARDARRINLGVSLSF
ncbi:MAG: TonB-dependent receptor [Acidobacteria bacterium]|nr:TonB-dependent receptor [Acidobacteriota bacterium]